METLTRTSCDTLDPSDDVTRGGVMLLSESWGKASLPTNRSTDWGDHDCSLVGGTNERQLPTRLFYTFPALPHHQRRNLRTMAWCNRINESSTNVCEHTVSEPKATRFHSSAGVEADVASISGRCTPGQWMYSSSQTMLNHPRPCWVNPFQNIL